MLAVLPAFPWGPLFAWSPVRPGYRQIRFSRVDVVYPDGAALDPAYHEVDRYPAEAEAFHEVKWDKRIRVVVCRQIERSGKDMFLRFERTCFSSPLACRGAFRSVYGIELRSAVEDFQEEVRSGQGVVPRRVLF